LQATKDSLKKLLKNKFVLKAKLTWKFFTRKFSLNFDHTKDRSNGKLSSLSLSFLQPF
jgi:hypothetical protein